MPPSCCPWPGPEHLVPGGGSRIGLDFAQMMLRSGGEVTVVERLTRLLPREHPDVSQGIREFVANE